MSQRSERRVKQRTPRVRTRKSENAILTAEIDVGPARRKLYILDDVLDESIRDEVFHTMWKLPFYHADQDRPDTGEFLHMVHLFSPAQHEESPLLRELAAAARGFLEAKGERIRGIERMYLNFGLFGDFQFAHRDGNVWTALVFVNKEWKSDWAGELLIYDDSSPRAPAYAIAPEPGRMVIFDGRIMHRGGVPSKHCFIPRLSLSIKLLRDPPRDAKRKRSRRG